MTPLFKRGGEVLDSLPQATRSGLGLGPLPQTSVSEGRLEETPILAEVTGVSTLGELISYCRLKPMTSKSDNAVKVSSE